MLIKNQRTVLCIIAVLSLFNVLAWSAVFNLNGPKFLKVNFFDVGQGDAIFIETPQRQQVLIDGGPSPQILDKLSGNMPFWDRTIDLIILTHPETDHMTGLLEVLKKYRVKNILWSGVEKETAEFEEWQRLIGEERNKEGAEVKIAKSGLKIIFSDDKSLNNYIDVLYPLEDFEGQKVKDANSASIVSRLVFGESSFLFCGDIYKSDEKKILERGVNIDSDIIKISHHGSKTSSEEEFIKEVSPEIAIISAGRENQYGHPNEETLETLEKYGIRILRTDEIGDIRIISDGGNFKIISDGKSHAISNF